MIIWNGNRKVDTDDPQTWSIGTLSRSDGAVIEVYRDNVAAAYAEAVGAPPRPPQLSEPGSLEPTYGKVTLGQGIAAHDEIIVTGYTYNPGPSDLNHALVAEYQAAVTAWNDHAAAQKSVLDVLIQQLKEHA